MITPKQILDVALTAGTIILINGAEIYRTEDTITRICQAYGMKFVQSIVTPTGIFLSIDDGDSVSETVVRRIHRRGLDLDKICRINEFSRRLQNNPLDYIVAMQELEQISSGKNEFSLTLGILLSSLGASMIVILLQGSYINIIPAFFAALVAQLIIEKIVFLKEVNFVPQMIAGFIGASISLLGFRLGLGDSLSIIIVSSILPFVPGVSLTNSIRDAINGDLISANSRGMEAILIAISLAIGVAAALGVFY